MKILKIKFSNINSLKGEHEIDFSRSPFTTGSLFAITGPTGSGKSTILDVISLALFNQIPRLGSISKTGISKTGAVITKNQLEAYAEVSYESKEGSYTSKWFIAFNRNNNLNDYGMELSEYGTGTVLDFKKSEVPTQNEVLIGLNYAQFIKSVVLAQGEFAQFLKARKDERSALLEKITGTGIYRELGKAAYDRFKEENLSILKKQDEIAVLKNNLLEEDVFEAKKKLLVEREEEIRSVEAQIKKHENKLELKQAILSRVEEISQLKDKTAKSQLDLGDFQEQYGERIQQHEKLQPHAEQLRLYKQKKEKIGETEIGIDKIKFKITEYAKQEEQLILAAQKLCGQTIDASGFTQSIQAFAEKVIDLQQKKSEKTSAYTHTLEQLKRELKGIAFQFDPHDTEVSIAQLKDLYSTTKGALSTLEAEMKGVDIAHLAAARQELQERLNAIINGKNEWSQIAPLKASIKEVEAKEEQLTSEKADLPAQILLSEKDIEAAGEKLERLKTEKVNRQLKADLTDLRNQLVKNEPCPVCGATDHPYAEEAVPEVDDLQAAILAQEKILEGHKEDRRKQRSRLEVLEEQLKDHARSKVQAEDNLIKLEKSVEAYSEKLGLSTTKINWDELSSTTNKQLQSIENIQELRLQTESIANAIPLHSNINEIIVAGKQLDQQLKALYQGDDIQRETRALLDAWIATQRDKQNAEASLKELEENLKAFIIEIDQLKTKLSADLKTIGFTDISDAQAALLGDSQYLDLRNQREQIQTELNTAKNQLELLSEQLEELKKRDTAESLEEIKVLLVERREQRTVLQNESDELRSIIKTQYTYQKQLEELKKAVAETEKKNLKWRLLNELIGDATGKKFNDFAQDLSLSQLLLLANKRLASLSDRYLLDKPDLKNEDDSLVAIDSHMGGQRRSVKTLSGGETFILSLSMALALSDLASRNVNINSLFIDEGFGTLDPETLDQTLDTLERLQAESLKTIGIISHVDSLKERISTQIKLSRNGQGYSKIDIVG